jgi:ribosomal protein L22
MADEKNDTQINNKKTADKKAEGSTPAKKQPAKKAAAKKAGAKKGAPKAESKKAAKKETKAAKKEAKGKEGKKAAAKGEAKESKKAAAKKEPAKKAAAKAPAAPPVVRASARYVRVAPRKARLVADQVRGLHIEQALALLQFSPRGASRDIQKLIQSAAANAENNHDLVGDEMRVASITVDEGPTLRRFRPRALGRATPINKRTSHIAVALVPDEED